MQVSRVLVSYWASSSAKFLPIGRPLHCGLFFKHSLMGGRMEQLYIFTFFVIGAACAFEAFRGW